MKKHHTHAVPSRPSDLPSGPPAALPFGGHLIRFVRCEFESRAKCLTALAVIEPPTKLPFPDIVIGFGQQEAEARKDAFARAQARIENCSAQSPRKTRARLTRPIVPNRSRGRESLSRSTGYGHSSVQ
jgi:hypothetical protein